MARGLDDLVQGAPLWERILTGLAVLAAALLTWLVARLLGHLLRGQKQFRLKGVERLAAPLTLLASLVVASFLLHESGQEAPLVDATLEFVGIAGLGWLFARVINLVWETGRTSARLRAHPPVHAALHALRYLGKLVVLVVIAAVLAVRLGAYQQLYLVLGGLGAAAAFAARDPIRNAVAFGSMVLDPPFHIGDTVRLADYRGREDATGEVIDVSLMSTTLRTRQHTLVVVANAKLMDLRMENLSAADARRLELIHPVEPHVSAEALRRACDAIESDVVANPHVAPRPRPRVWLSGFDEGMQLKVSAWLHPGTDRREAKHELLLLMHAGLEVEHAAGGPGGWDASPSEPEGDESDSTNEIETEAAREAESGSDARH